jgi:Ca2+-binding EF-hand superfamily protein
MSAQASTNYKEAFSLFDKRGTGRVPADELGDLLRACGQNPTLGEVAELQKGVGRECTFFHFSFGFPIGKKKARKNAN